MFHSQQKTLFAEIKMSKASVAEKSGSQGMIPAKHLDFRSPGGKGTIIIYLTREISHSILHLEKKKSAAEHNLSQMHPYLWCQRQSFPKQGSRLQALISSRWPYGSLHVPEGSDRKCQM